MRSVLSDYDKPIAGLKAAAERARKWLRLVA